MFVIFLIKDGSSVEIVIERVGEAPNDVQIAKNHVEFRENYTTGGPGYLGEPIIEIGAIEVTILVHCILILLSLDRLKITVIRKTFVKFF